MTTPSKVQRWETYSNAIGSDTVYEDADGDFVAYPDYAALSARCAELEAVVEQRNTMLSDRWARIQELEAELAKVTTTRDAFKSVLDDEVAENLAFMDKAGKLHDENIGQLMDRILAERDELKKAAHRFGEICAVIFGDGGHRQAAIGDDD